MAKLPPPVAPPPLNCLAVAEVYLDEPQVVPNLPVFAYGSDTRESYRNVAKVKFTCGDETPCIGVTIDAKPAATREIDKRVSVAISGIVSLLCPSQDMKNAFPGHWVFVKKDVFQSAKFRAPYPERLPKLHFHFRPDLTENVYIGRLLIKDDINNLVTIDLCPS